MDREELLLDIAEKIYDKVEKLDEKVGQIQVQQAVHDKVVADHSARSTASEMRLDKLEKQSAFIDTTLKVLVGLGTVTTFALSIYKFFQFHR